MAVQIITDAACDLTEESARQLGIKLVPMTIHFENESFHSGYDLTNEEFYSRMETSASLPTTSQPTPFEYSRIFDEIVKAGDQAVVICMSSALSGTCQSATIAASDYPGSIYVVDSQSVTVGQRILVDYARKLRDENFSAEKLAACLEEVRKKIRVFGIVHTLDYLVKGGRLSRAAGTAGTLLGIRPVLQIEEGVLKVISKARGPKAAYNTMNRLIREANPDPAMPRLISHTGISSEDLDAYLAAENSPWTQDEISSDIIGSTIGTHAGPHLIACAFFTKN